MIFKQIESGGDRNYSYLIGCPNSKSAVLIDPSPDFERCDTEVKKTGLKLVYIINTHSHPDHTGGNDYFCDKKNVKLITHLSRDGDIKIKDNDMISLSDDNDAIKLTFFHTPGHTEDAICIQIENNLITGDTLFVGKVGGTYTENDARNEFESLKQLMKLPKKMLVWPGHNYGTAPRSTIENEIKTNPFIQRLNSFNEFIWLKQNWGEFKIEHGIK
jgi:glyoxylase-like metal-dependent hydrolase (beta-lactamase superfamily II)